MKKNLLRNGEQNLKKDEYTKDVEEVLLTLTRKLRLSIYSMAFLFNSKELSKLVTI